MSANQVTLLFADGAARRFEAEDGANIVEAAAQAGLNLLTDCANGQCGTCTASLVAGDVELGHYDRSVLPDEDRKCGAILACVCKVKGSCVVELPYDSSEASADEPEPLAGRVLCVERVAAETVRLEVALDAPLDFHAGQYVRMRPAGGAEWRSYSMANASGSTHLVFYIRLVPGGSFSTWLAEQAKAGDTLELSEPRGSFFLRDEQRPRLFVAGGTGLAPFLSMLSQLAQREPAAPTTLLVGVRSGEHLFATEEVERWRAMLPGLQIRFAAESSPGELCSEGYATDLIKDLQLGMDTRVYLCGPPPMVEAGRAAVAAQGLARGDVLCERFA